MELTPALILNLVLLIVPPIVLVLMFRQWLAQHIHWTVALIALCDVLLFWDELFYYALIVKVVVSKNLYFLFVQVIRYCSVPDVSINK